VRREEVGHRGVVTGGKLVARPRVNLAVQRLKLLDELIRQGEHLVRRHAVGRHLVGEVVVVAQRLHRLVAEVAQSHDAVLQRGSDRLGGLPRALSRPQVAALPEHGVDLVGGDRPVADSKLEPVELFGLLGLGGNARTDDVRDGLRAAAGFVQHLLQLPNLHGAESVAVREVSANRLDIVGCTDECEKRLVRGLRAGRIRRVAIDDAGVRCPLREAPLVSEFLVGGVILLQERVDLGL
jgi:hypothetical protein